MIKSVIPGTNQISFCWNQSNLSLCKHFYHPSLFLPRNKILKKKKGNKSAYQDLLWKLPVEGPIDIVDWQSDDFYMGYRWVPPTVGLKVDSKRGQGRISWSHANKLIAARPHEVIFFSIKSCEVRVSSSPASSVATRLATAHSFNYCTLLVFLAAALFTNHQSQGRVALTMYTALVIKPEFFIGWVVRVVEWKTTMWHGNTLINAKDEMFVALACLHAVVWTVEWRSAVYACSWTGTSTGLIMAVCRTWHSCDKNNNNEISFWMLYPQL